MNETSSIWINYVINRIFVSYGKTQLQEARSMNKTEYHYDTCEYCGLPSTVFTTNLTGEPVSMCKGKVCSVENDRLLDLERKELAQTGLTDQDEY